MSNATFLYNPQSDRAALSGGAWLTGAVGLTNVQNDKYWRVARSVTASIADTQIRVNMLVDVAVRGFATVINNATTAARVRASAYSDANYSSPIFFSDWFDGGESGTTWRDEERSPIISGEFGTEITARYWLIEIDDQLNPSGYLDVGRLFMGSAISPSFNYAYEGNSLRLKNNAITATTLAGNTLYWRRINPRQWNCTFQYLPEVEIFGSAYDFIRYVGFDREVFIMPDPDNTQFAQVRQFFATIIQQDPFQQLAWEHGSFGFGVEERIAIATATSNDEIVPTDFLTWTNYAPDILASKPVGIPTSEFVWTDYIPVVSSGVNIGVPSDDMIMDDYSPAVGGIAIFVPTDEDMEWFDYNPDQFRAFDSGFDAGFS
jgi:hypothetical protein